MICVQSYDKKINTQNIELIQNDNLEKILTGQTTVSTLCKELADITRSKLCCILLSKREPEDSDSLFNIVFSTDPSISLCKEMPLLSIAFDEKIIVISNDIANDPRNDNYLDKNCPIKKFCGIPIIKDDIAYGQIILANKRKGYRITTLDKIKPQINFISNIIISGDENIVFGNSCNKVNNLKFLSSIAHEIRTPIHGIISMISLLEEAGPLNEKQRHYISYSLSSCEDLIEIVKDSIDFQKIKTGSLGIINDTFDIRDLFEKTIELISFKAERKHLYLTLDIENSIPKMVYGDKDRLRQILLNIIGNAIKYTSIGGVNVIVKQYPSRIIIIIKDTGCGIKSENLNKIFMEYFQEEKYGKNGMGLGLSLSKRLIQMMGGDIIVESIYGKGSTFTIDLPLSQEYYNLDELSDDKNLSILVVDDNDTNRIQLRDYFKQWELNVDAVSSFKEAKNMTKYSNYDIFMINSISNIGDAYSFAHYIDDNFPNSRIVSIGRTSGDNNIFDAYIDNVGNKGGIYNVILSVKKDKTKRQPSREVDKSNLKICIVEDDDISAFALSEILICYGISKNNINILDTGEQAVRDITHNRYDVVFMDCKLRTEMNGIKATKLIKQNVSGLKVYGVTAAITDEEKIEWLNSGLDGIIFKPFDKKMIKPIVDIFG